MGKRKSKKQKQITQKENSTESIQNQLPLRTQIDFISNKSEMPSLNEGPKLNEAEYKRLLSLSEKGLAKYQYDLGMYIINHLDKLKEGITWVFRSAENGCSNAKNYLTTNLKKLDELENQITDDIYLQYSISLILLSPSSGTEYQSKGNALLSSAAKSGFIKAKLMLFIFENGIDINSLIEEMNSMIPNQTSEKGVVLIQKTFKIYMQTEKLFYKILNECANNGLQKAQFLLGILILVNSNNSHYDIESGKDWIQVSAERNHYESQLLLSKLYLEGVLGYEKDIKQAFYLCKEAASHGFAEAEYNLSPYFNGGVGTKKNSEMAFNTMLSASEGLYVSAIFQVGLFYKLGVGVEKNERLAYKCIKKAAKMFDYIDAYYVLGIMYLEGKGTDKDELKGLKSLELASEKGNLNADYLIGDCYFKGIGTSVNYKKATEYYMKASKSGSSKAMLKLGICYLDGNGITKDLNNAYKYIEQSARLGNQDAEDLLAELKQN